MLCFAWFCFCLSLFLCVFVCACSILYLSLPGLVRYFSSVLYLAENARVWFWAYFSFCACAQLFFACFRLCLCFCVVLLFLFVFVCAHFCFRLYLCLLLSVSVSLFVSQFSKSPTFVAGLCEPIGVQDKNKIPDSSMTASSYFDGRYYPYYGRLHETRGHGWAPKTKTDRTDYLQVDLGALHSVCALATQGRKEGEWATRYKVSLSRDGVSWSFYQEDNKLKVLERF